MKTGSGGNKQEVRFIVLKSEFDGSRGLFSTVSGKSYLPSAKSHLNICREEEEEKEEDVAQFDLPDETFRRVLPNVFSADCSGNGCIKLAVDFLRYTSRCYAKAALICTSGGDSTTRAIRDETERSAREG